MNIPHNYYTHSMCGEALGRCLQIYLHLILAKLSTLFANRSYLCMLIGIFLSRKDLTLKALEVYFIAAYHS